MSSEPSGDSTPCGNVRAIIAGHASFASGMISAVDQITGRGSVFRAISGMGLSLEAIQQALASALDETGARVVFTDLPAGSCTMVARRELRGRSEVLLVAGTNLPVLLDFALQPLESEPLEAARNALERGKAAMSVYAS